MIECVEMWGEVVGGWEDGVKERGVDVGYLDIFEVV